MKKMMPMLLCIAVCVVICCFVMMKMRSSGGMFMKSQPVASADLVIINDTSDTFSTAFVRDGKTMSQVVRAKEKATGGRGLLRIFIANKNGNYEIQYPYPRPTGKPVEVSLSQILKAAHTPELGQEIYSEKGKIDDIRVDYEEVRDMQATY